MFINCCVIIFQVKRRKTDHQLRYPRDKTNHHQLGRYPRDKIKLIINS